MPDHSPYSPSTWGDLAACPSFLKGVGAPHPTASRGTLIHEVAESGDTEKLTDPADLKVLQAYWDHLHELSQRRPGHTYKTYVELRVPVLDQWGYIDYLLIWDDGFANLCDLKTGWLSVPDAEENDQIVGYNIGVFDRFPEVHTIESDILLPQRNERSNVTFTREKDYARLVTRGQWILLRAKNESGLTFNPTPAGCLYCHRKGICVAFMNQALPLARKYSGRFELPEEVHPSKISTLEQMNLALHLTRALSPWIDSVNFHANQLLDLGFEFDDFERRETQGTPEITDPQKAAQVAMEQFGVPLEDLIKIAKLSFTKLVKYVTDHAPRGDKAAMKNQLKVALLNADALTLGEPRKEIRKRNR